MTPREIAVAGCGTAGLASALLLARDGHAVRLFERFDAPKPIGSGLMIQPTGLAVLDQLGLADAVIGAGARIERLFGKACGSGRTVLDVRYDALGGGMMGIGLHRATLFDTLHRAVVAAGIPIETGRVVTTTSAEAGGRRSLGFADGGRAGPFDLVVDALGTFTPLAPPTGRILPYGALWASLDWPDGAGFDEVALEQRYVRGQIMVGVLPIGTPPGATRPKTAFFWSLRTDRLEAWRSEGLDAWKAQVLARWPATAPLLDQVETPERMTFARYAHRTLRRPAEPGLIHIGDAWHSTSPQLGQGANMALLDAWSLAQGMRDCTDIAPALDRAVAQRRFHVHLYQAMSLVFTPVFQSDSRILPLLRDGFVGPLSDLRLIARLQAQAVAGLIGNPLPRLGLAL